jgi:hypothetical protein
MFPAAKLESEQALLTVALAFSPTITANLLHLNLDFGVLVFLIPSIYFLYTGSLLGIAIAGTLMVFTKETGAALYVILLATYVLVFELPAVTKVNWLCILRRISLFGIPLALYLLRIIYRVVRHPELNVFYTEDGYAFEEKSLPEMIFDFSPFDPTFRAYLIDIFLLQFNWIITVSLILGCIFLIKVKKFTVKTYFSDKQLMFSLLLLVGTVYLVTRHRPFNHVRYLLTAQPLLLLLCYAGVVERFIPAVKKLIFVTVAVLYAYSNVHTLDPVSKYLFGTFRFGEHHLLNMSSNFFKATDERPVFNRDELVYNLEYLKIHEISELIFQDIKLDPYLTFMGTQDSRFFWPGLVDSTTLKRTGRRQGVFKPHYFDYVKEFADVVDKPRVLYYLEFPNIASSAQLVHLNQWYKYRGKKEYSLDGYSIEVSIFDKII